jgi:hypothetical protein
MKYFIISLLSLFSFHSFAEFKNITFKEMMVNKNTFNEYGFIFTGYVSKKSWCLKRGTPYEFGSFESARDMEKMENGLYRCDGEFVRLPFGKINAFKIQKCTLVDLDLLKKECENIIQ